MSSALAYLFSPTNSGIGLYSSSVGLDVSTSLKKTIKNVTPNQNPEKKLLVRIKNNYEKNNNSLFYINYISCC